MNQIWNSIITGSFAILGSASANIVTLIINSRQIKNQIAQDREKQVDETKKARIAVYNRVLAENSTGGIITGNIIPSVTINIDKYRQSISKILFENLHALDPDVREKLYELEEPVSKIVHYTELGVRIADMLEDLNTAKGLYRELIQIIKNHYN